MSNSTRFAVIVLSLFALCSCGSADKDAHNNRPYDPWVFRSVLDSVPRIVTLALNENLWAAYHTDKCAIYKVWKGNVKFEGAVYDTNHGPQPTSTGDSWFNGAVQEPWFIVQNGMETKPAVQYRGHRFSDGGVTLHYELKTAEGKIIHVYEKPEYIARESGQNGFERVFSITDLPAGMQVGLLTNVSSVVSQEMIETNGTFTTLTSTPRASGDLSSVDISGKLLLQPKEKTSFTTWFVSKPMIPNPRDIIDPAAMVDIKPGALLINKNDCKTCHNEQVKTVGPSYMEIAAKYPNTPEMVTMLSTKVKVGGSGVWGQVAMTAHPELPKEDINTMVRYIMALDSAEEAKNAGNNQLVLKKVDEATAKSPVTDIKEDQLLPGAWCKVIQQTQIQKLADIKPNQAPVYEGMLPVLNAQGGDFRDLAENFAIIASGYINIEKTNNYLFRLSSDDGSRMSIDGNIIITNDGEHGEEARDGEIALKKGLHSFKVEYFNSRGGKMVSLKWKSFDDKDFSVVPTTALYHKKSDMLQSKTPALPMSEVTRIPGDGIPEAGVHPSFDLSQARPDDFLPKVGGMDFLPDGRLVVSTWDANGAVYILSNVQSGDPKKIVAKQIAKGLAEPLGLKCIGKDIYVMQKQELTKLTDHDGDDIIDEYYTVCNGWTVSANFHEFAFGLIYRDGYFYGTLATDILPGGASGRPQPADRGKVIKISEKDGSYTFPAQGLRTPNGIGFGKDNEIFIADNQGDWLPSSKILHLSTGAFFGSYSVDSANQVKLPVKQPVLWLPQDDIGNSPSQPLWLNEGPYKGQMMHGEVTHGGIKRDFIEKVNGEYQGCVFRFMNGLEAGVNRMVWGPDGALYVGGIGNPGNWQTSGLKWYGLQRLKYNGKTAFEMLAVRAKSNGVEIEFTEPLMVGDGWNPADYLVKQWYYKPTPDYGGPKLDEKQLKVIGATVSKDRRKVFLELAGMKEGHVVYIKLLNHLVSEKNNELWSTEAWYTMNKIPVNNPGTTLLNPTAGLPNTLSPEEVQAGWKLLFDGKSMNGWHTYGKKTIGASWKVLDNAITLSPEKGGDGGFQVKDGGDILTADEYENFELSLEWKIASCGNSGIMYNIIEDPVKYKFPWETGPEMQVLDNVCHPDTRYPKHRAGDLYDMIECKFMTVKPAGSWNKARLVINKGKVEHWLNGHKVVSFTMFDENWRNMIKASKFKDMPAFGTGKKGRIALQDHGDRVQFRNVKIRVL
jgi:cytochrome c